VAGAGGRAAHGVVAGPALDQHAPGVGQAVDAVGLGADAVAFDPVGGRARVEDPDARSRVAGDGVGGAGVRAADGIAAGPGIDHHAILVGQGGTAVGVRADAVALDRVAGRARAADPDAVVGVAGEGVGGPRLGPAHGVAAGPALDHHALAVGQGGTAGGVGADAVALDPVGGRAAVGDRDAVVGVAGDGIAGAGGRAAHGVVAGPALDQHAPSVGQG